MNTKKLSATTALIFILIAISIRANSVFTHFQPFIDSIFTIYYNRHTTYQQRLALKYPQLIPFVQKFKTYVSEESYTYLPPKTIRHGHPMWSLANAKNMYALTFPRKFVKFKEDQVIEKINHTPTYAVIFQGYPNFFVKAQRTIIFSKEGDQIISGDYSPEDYSYEQLGIIQL